MEIVGRGGCRVKPLLLLEDNQDCHQISCCMILTQRVPKSFSSGVDQCANFCNLKSADLLMKVRVLPDGDIQKPPYFQALSGRMVAYRHQLHDFMMLIAGL